MNNTTRVKCSILSSYQKYSEVLFNERGNVVYLQVTPNEVQSFDDVTLNVSNTEGTITADWVLKDTEGTSVNEYTVILYKGTTKVGEYKTNVNTYTFTGLAEGDYYVVVYGVDAACNSGESSLGSATTSDGYASKSSSINARWNFSVGYNLENLTSDGANTVKRGSTYTATLTARTVYTLPTSITVTMNGDTLTENQDYTYSNGKITIPDVQGDLNISATAGCLVEGTKILLANGKTKKY